MDPRAHLKNTIARPLSNRCNDIRHTSRAGLRSASGTVVQIPEEDEAFSLRVSASSQTTVSRYCSRRSSLVCHGLSRSAAIGSYPYRSIVLLTRVRNHQGRIQPAETPAMHGNRAGGQHRAEPGIGAQQRRTRDAHTHTATLRAEGQGHEHRQRGAAGMTIDQLTLYRLKALLPSAWSISSSWTASSEYIATLMSVVFIGMFRVCHPALRVMPTPLVGHVVAGSRLNNNPSPPHVHAGWPLASCLFGWVTSHSVCSGQAIYTRPPQHWPRCMHLSKV